ncbi:MAG TPA: CdaR family protein [Verrucomicrobiae bacterium]|nr:CdaR family protein [Verrucomicrobiae bacterium]
MIAFLQNLILKDFWLKLFSFALATLVWIIVNIAIKKDISPGSTLSLTPTEQVVLRDLPILVVSAAEDARAFTVTPRSAVVTLQGEPANLKNLRKQDVRVTVDLSDTGSIQDARKRVEVSTPAGVSRVKVDPEEVQVSQKN